MVFGAPCNSGSAVAVRFVLPLLGGLIEFFVVGKRVGIWPNHMGMDESGTAALAAILDCFLAYRVAFQRVGAVTLGDMQIRETAGQTGDAAARGLDLDRDGDGVAVIFDQIQEWQFLGASGVERLPEFALAGSAVSG
jgi:hypothetical protein